MGFRGASPSTILHSFSPSSTQQAEKFKGVGSDGKNAPLSPPLVPTHTTPGKSSQILLVEANKGPHRGLYPALVGYLLLQTLCYSVRDSLGFLHSDHPLRLRKLSLISNYINKTLRLPGFPPPSGLESPHPLPSPSQLHGLPLLLTPPHPLLPVTGVFQPCIPSPTFWSWVSQVSSFYGMSLTLSSSIL